MIDVAGEAILLVDDNPDVSGAFATCLELAGYRVHVASSGAEARELAAAHPDDIALILTDLAMPGMAGRDLIRALRYDGLRVPVIVMSGFPRGEGMLDPPGEEVAAWLQKPFTVDDLVDAVGRTLARQSPASTA
jgi:DNA-binding NtrC family response regulator